jgi:hypothetical protein
VIELLLPVLRELGLVTIFWDVHFTNSWPTRLSSGASTSSWPSWNGWRGC